MNEKKIFVYLDLNNKSQLVGHLFARQKNGRESASFQYDPSWLTHPEKFAIEPALMLTDGTYHTEPSKTLFGAIGDSAPDRWGRMLMRRATVQKARRQNKTPPTLSEIDYLLGVNDQARQGALRFCEQLNGTFCQHCKTDAIPPLVELPKLLSATHHLIKNKESEKEINLLLAPGSSLGGARPKASIIDRNGELIIAKFPSPDDDYSTIMWESVALTLAKLSGLKVPAWRLETIAGKQTLLIQRFDRQGSTRIPYLSAMSLLGVKDNDQRSYLEIEDAIRHYGAQPEEDSYELWKRIVFNILISNTDDHLRNHGFLYQSQKGWSLSPIFDINPTPVEIRPRVLTTFIDLNDGTASLDLAFKVAKNFGLSQEEAKSCAKIVGKAISKWQSVAKNLKIARREIDRISSAFEHQDLKTALAN